MLEMRCSPTSSPKRVLISLLKMVNWCSTQANLIVEHQLCDSALSACTTLVHCCRHPKDVVGFVQHVEVVKLDPKLKQYRSCPEINGRVSDLDRDIIL